jgi:putative FmdB family regulatory protein
VEDPVPTYQYACTACDHRFEAVQSFSDASLTECPACSGGLRKVFSSVGIVFKGSGFYRTDSRSGAGSTVGGGDKGAPAEGGGTKTEAKKDSGSTTPASTSSSSSSSSSGSAPAAAASS